MTNSTVEPTRDVQGPWYNLEISWFKLSLLWYEKYLLYKGKTKIKPRIKFSLNIIPLVKVANGKVIAHFFKVAILVPTWSFEKVPVGNIIPSSFFKLLSSSRSNSGLYLEWDLYSIFHCHPLNLRKMIYFFLNLIPSLQRNI